MRVASDLHHDPQAAIEVADLRRTYRITRGLIRRRRELHTALRGVDLTIRQGELFGLLGPNGAGKTTMVKILTTLLLPSAGTARVLGLDVAKQPRALRRRIGFVLGGERGLYWRLSGFDNLRYFADLYHLPPEVSKVRIPELLERFDLGVCAHNRVETYSRGMKQRLHLARGLLNDPEVLFLDEPTIGLDPVSARQLRELIRSLAENGKTIFLTTHYMFEADAICDRIAVIRDGTILAQGTPAALKSEAVGEGVIEFQTQGMSSEELVRLRTLDGVITVLSTTHDLEQLVTVQCMQPTSVLARLAEYLDDRDRPTMRLREPTLEDAYIRLISQ